jgi:hypothetical protein
MKALDDAADDAAEGEDQPPERADELLELLHPHEPSAGPGCPVGSLLRAWSGRSSAAG